MSSLARTARLPTLGIRSLVDPRALARATPRGILAPLALTIALRLTLLALFPIHPEWDGVIYARIADDLAAGEGYTHASIDRSAPRGPTAFFPVGFPAAIAPLRGLGAGRALDPIAQVLLGAAIVPVVALLGRRAAGASGGRIAAWIAALWPGGVLLSLSWMSEPLFTLLTTSAVLALAMARRARADRALVVASILLGLAAYVRPTAILVAIVLAIASARSLRGAPRRVAIAIAVLAIVVAPWSIRNLVVLGAPAVVSTNGGTNLLLGTIDEGRFGAIPPELDCPSHTEIERDHCRTSLAIDRMLASPGDTGARALVKLAHTFGHESGPAELWARSLRGSDALRASARLWALGTSRLAWLALFAAACAGGALLAIARRRTLLATLLAPTVAIAILHAITLGGDRYHAPAVPAAIAVAAVAIAALERARRA